jgi:hypothetical protein
MSMSDSDTKITEDLKEKQQKINNSPSNTIPVVIIWCVYLALVIILRIIIHGKDNTGSEFDLKTLTWVVGGATFSYMLGGHVTSFLQNKSLPSGFGEIKDINRYKTIVWFWIAVTLIGMIAYFAFNVDAIPHTDILSISGFISIEYIAGNRCNKIATNMGENVK